MLRCARSWLRSEPVRRYLHLLAVGLIAIGTGAPIEARNPAPWLQIESDRFVLFSNIDPNRLQRLAGGLERLHGVLTSLNPGRAHEAPPLHIFVFADNEDLEPYKPRSGAGAASLSGYFLAHPHLDFIAIDGDPTLDTAGLLAHEYLHAFVRHHLPHAPLWLNEGLAELYSTFAVEGQVAIVGRPVSQHVDWLHNHRLMSLDRFLDLDTGSQAYNDRDRQPAFYAQAWGLVHYLLTGSDELRDGLGEYLKRLADGHRSREAFSDALGASPTRIERGVRRHVAPVEIPVLTTTVDRTGKGRRPAFLGEADRWFQLGWLLSHQNPPRLDEARRHFEAALGTDREHGGAVMGLGYLAALSGDPSAAIYAYREAMAVGLDSYLVHYLHARALAARNTDGDRDLAREAFRRSLQRRPSFAQAWAGLGATWVSDPQPEEEGLEALEKAFRRLPTRPDVIYNLILLSARMGHVEQAESLVEKLRVRADPEWASRAEQALEGAVQ